MIRQRNKWKSETGAATATITTTISAAPPAKATMEAVCSLQTRLIKNR